MAPTFQTLDVLRVLDAAYDVDADDASWLRAIAEASRPLLERDGDGVHAFTFDLQRDARQALGTPLLAGGTPSWAERWRAEWWAPFMLALDAASLRELLSFGPVTYTTDLYVGASARVPTLELLLQERALLDGERLKFDNAFQYPDSLNVVAVDPTGAGVALIGNRSKPADAPPDLATRTVFASLCGHLANATRLRRAVRSKRALLDSADAIFDPKAKLLHAASGEVAKLARDSLRGAVSGVTATRSARHDVSGAEALELWRALYLGRYSVIDAYDTDGKRYVIARRNEPATPRPAPTSLTPRETQVLSLLAHGHSNKVIAYELGLSPSTVSSHLASAARKLGVRGASELVVAARKLAAEGP